MASRAEMGPLALACLSSCFFGCGARPAHGARPAPEPEVSGAPDAVFVRSLPWLKAPPEIGGPGEIHIATNQSWDLYEEAGGQQREGSPPYSVFAFTPDGVTIAVELTGPEPLAFHREGDGWLFAHHTAARDEISVVQTDRAGTVRATHAFESPDRLVDVTPLTLPSRTILVRRPVEFPGGGGGVEAQLGPAYPSDLAVVRWCEPDCHAPAALLTRGEQLLVVLAPLDGVEAPMNLGVVTREGVRDVEPLRSSDRATACENAIYAQDGDVARARLPRGMGGSAAIAIEGARWIPGPNVHPIDLEVCVEAGRLRVRAAEGAWVSVADRVDPERVWVSCDGRACVSVFAAVDGTSRLARFAL